MRVKTISSAWWGAPRKFDPHFEKRSISWLELFYDLVYVIAISRITHHLAMHMSVDGFWQYACLFILVFWGWLNGRFVLRSSWQQGPSHPVDDAVASDAHCSVGSNDRSALPYLVCRYYDRFYD